MSDNNVKSKNIWEVPSIDLNLRHYSGSVSDVFERIKSDIETYLMSPDVPQKSREIYSAIYNALEYYEVLSPEFSDDNNFLNSAIDVFNEDLEYLSKKYSSNNPFDMPIISLSARIKSPLSFVEKVKDKVNEYLVEGRDFAYFNESLRDIIGVRVIINPPSEIKAQGLQAQSDYLYNIFYDLMRYRGILNPEDPSSFRFLDINTRHDRTKLEKMKATTYPGRFISSKTPLTRLIQSDLDSYRYIVKPETRPDFMEAIDSKVKDYHFYPKKNGYQSIHICVVPSFSSEISQRELPDCILPSKVSDYAIEYQFRDAREDEYSSKGPASHGSLKPYEKIYHRLAVPSFIDSDGTSNLMPRDFGENYQLFYGPSFEDRFNISYPLFVSTFDQETQDEILAGRKLVDFNELTNTYYVSSTVFPVFVEEEDFDLLRTPVSLLDFLETSHISDSAIIPTEAATSTGIIDSSKNEIKLYRFRSPYREKARCTRGSSLDEKAIGFDDNI